jgi:hypothetical protein
MTAAELRPGMRVKLISR